MGKVAIKFSGIRKAYAVMSELVELAEWNALDCTADDCVTAAKAIEPPLAFALASVLRWGWQAFAGIKSLRGK